MLKLIYNELIKIFKRKSTIVAVAVMLLMCFAVQGIIKIELEMMSDFYNEDIDDNRTVDEWEKDMFYGISDNNPDFEYERAQLKAYRELGIETMNDYRCEIVDMIIMSNSDDNGKLDHEAIDEAIATVKESKGSYVDFLEGMAKNGDTEYKNEDLSDAITNQYKYLLDKGVTEKDDSRVKDVNEIIMLQQMLDGFPEEERQDAQYVNSLKQYKQMRYALDNDLDCYVTDQTSSDIYGQIKDGEGFWISLLNSTAVLTIISICMIVLAGQVVAREFSEGTIKFLIVNPVKRGKIITSKYLTIMAVSFALSALSFVVNIIVAMLFNGAGSIGATYVSYSAASGKIVSYAALLYFLKMYAIRFVQVVIYASMAFAISSLLKSTAAAVGVGVACMMCGNIVSTMLCQFGQDWGRYLIFSNANLESVMQGITGYPGHTVAFAVGVIVVHMIVFLLSAYDGFVRREV